MTRPPYLNVDVLPEDREYLTPHLVKGWGYLGRWLKGNTDEVLIKKLLALEFDGQGRGLVISNLLGRARSIERKRILAGILRRRKTK